MDINVLALAYMGDAIYEVYIRKYLIKNNIVKVNELQKNSIKYVSAPNQAEILKNFSRSNKGRVLSLASSSIRSSKLSQLISRLR